MGLCKCPKRRVTNQFCFEHRVNVCEHCMVTNHPKCIIQSYLQWLQDSDYNPICELCTEALADGVCVRLICYHVYHWNCIDQYARELPATTAPAGYVCPSCKVCLFPASNLVSPVADVLKEKLAGFNWARAGLGLPLLIEEQTRPSETRKLITENSSAFTTDSHKLNNSHHHHQHHSIPAREQQNNTIDTDGGQGGDKLHSVVHVDDGNLPFSRTDNHPVTKKIFQDVDDYKSESYHDHDENKYKRRSAMEWFSRWWKTISRPAPRSRHTGHLYKRYIMGGVLFIIALLTIIMMFSWLGRMATKDDPIFEPHNNPNIRIASNAEA